jgi:glycosyltransferase involved in cell wall biosynthesis
MRVLYLIDSLTAGGAERSLAAMAPRLVAEGVELDVVYLMERRGVHGELRRAGAGLWSLDGGGGRAGRVARVRALVRRLRPHLVHTTLFEADVAGRVGAALAGVPSVSSLVNVTYEHGPATGVPRWKLGGAMVMDRLTARLARRFHAISRHAAEVAMRVLALPPERIEVIPRGRDPAALGRRSDDRGALARRSLGVDDATPLVIAAARQERQKGLDVLLKAVPRLRALVPEARLVVAGRPGALTDSLRREGDRLGAAVGFLGPRDDVPDLLAAADVFAMPSRWEGLGSVLLEAMALEAPVVASDLPAVREVVGHDALLVPPGDPDALAAALATTLLDREGAAARAERARARFEASFTADRVADAMLGFYRRALRR